MHSLQPPIVQCMGEPGRRRGGGGDWNTSYVVYLQAENLLLDSDGVIKLCDFGSATTQQLNPDSSWTAVQRGLTEDEVRMWEGGEERVNRVEDEVCGDSSG